MTATAAYVPAHAVSSPSRVGQVACLVARTLADRWRSLLGWGIGLVGMCVVQLAVYPSVHSARQGMQAFVDQWPEAFREAFGLQAYSTGPGFLNAELFSLMVPFIMIAVGLSAAAAATAGEEEAGTADLLFALPVSRGRVLAAKAAAMVLDVTTLAVAGWVVLAVGAPLVDLQVSVGGLTAALVMTALLGLLYASVGLLLGAATGRRAVTLGVGIGLAVGAFLLNVLAPMADWLEPWREASPFAWALGANPLVGGVDAARAGLLVGVTLGLLGGAWLVLRRRDITAR